MNAPATCGGQACGRLRSCAQVVFTILSLAACQPREAQPLVERGVPAPSFAGQLVAVGPEGVPQADFLAYAQGLQYDTADGAGDEQRLAIADTIVSPPDTLYFRHGPLVRIDPAIGTHALSPESLAAGRVIARLRNRSDEDYPKLALRAQGTTYWWVDSVQTGRWRSVLVSSDRVVEPLTLPLTFAPETHEWRQSLVRFVWDERDEGLWGTCGSRCCKT